MKLQGLGPKRNQLHVRITDEELFALNSLLKIYGGSQGRLIGAMLLDYAESWLLPPVSKRAPKTRVKSKSTRKP